MWLFLAFSFLFVIVTFIGVAIIVIPVSVISIISVVPLSGCFQNKYCENHN